MREHPWMMKRLADGFFSLPCQSITRHESASLPTKSFSCGTCGKQFPTLQAASTHEWSVHRRRQIGADDINESGRCPVCNRNIPHKATRNQACGIGRSVQRWALPQEMSRRSQRYTGRSLTMLIVSKLVTPGNLASVYTDHMAYELYLSFHFTPRVQPTYEGQLKWFYRANCSVLLSCECTRFKHGYLVLSIVRPHVLPTSGGQLKWFDRTNCHGFVYRVKALISTRLFGSQCVTL